MNREASAHDKQVRTGPAVISYATIDRSKALSICQEIERRGERCWIACRDVALGENYQEEIVRAIREAQALVLVFSEAANQSDEIKKELSLASRYHVPVFALRIADVEPNDAFAYELSTRQWIDAFEGWDRSIDTLVGKLDQVSAGEARDRATPTKRAVRRGFGRWSRWRLPLAALALIAILTTAAALLWNPFRTKEPLTVQIAGFQALAGVPAETPVAFQQELRAAFGDRNAVAIKDKNATFKLDGSIRNMGDNVQYSVQLIDSRTGEMIWSAVRKVDPASGSVAPRQVASGVASIVRCGLGDSMDYSGGLPTRTLSLYLLHCRYDYWGGAGRPERRIDVIKQVVQQTPNFSKGWSKLAVDAGSAAQDAAPDKKSQFIAMGDHAVRRALKLDPRNGEAYMAWASLQPPTAWAERERLHRKSVEVRESDCGCEHEQFGLFLLSVGRPSEAVSEFRRARDMQPNSFYVLSGLAHAYYGQGDILSGDRMVANLVAFWGGTLIAKEALLFQAIITNRWDKTGELARSLISDPAISNPADAPLVEGFAAVAANDPRRIAAARTALAALNDDWWSDYQTILLTKMGAHEEALAVAKTRLASGDVGLLLEPTLAPLRKYPAWEAMVRSTGLVDYWRKSKKPPEFCKAADAPPLCKTI
jgi:hypothetical protein